MTMDKWILDDKGEAVQADTLTWARWFEHADRHLALDAFDGVTVSTVFLGIDHQWGGGPPLLWETMIFGLPGEEDEYQTRASSRAEALEQHKAAIAHARRVLGKELTP